VLEHAGFPLSKVPLHWRHQGSVSWEPITGGTGGEAGPAKTSTMVSKAGMDQRGKPYVVHFVFAKSTEMARAHLL